MRGINGFFLALAWARRCPAWVGVRLACPGLGFQYRGEIAGDLAALLDRRLFSFQLRHIPKQLILVKIKDPSEDCVTLLFVAIALKLIIAIIQPGKLEAVKKALSQVEVVRLTVLDCQGFGRQRGQVGQLAGQQIGLNLLPKLQLQIAVNEEFVAPTVAAITEGGQSGEIGDGKIFVLPMDDCIRIRTGQRGSEAI